MSDTPFFDSTGFNECDCCPGTTGETPVARFNREGLDEIRYRVGDHRSFKRTMLADLSSPAHPALRQLTTRSDDDFSIALIDAWATTADVLAFYQERLANESYLRTATENESVHRLARLIDYRPAPGVAADTWFVFEMEAAPGAPDSVRVDVGAKVQSVPGQDEKPQTFETTETLEARLEWNAMRPVATSPSPILRGALVSENIRETWFRGIATRLRAGDAILIVGDERAQGPSTYPDKERWDFRILTRVTEHPDRNLTHVEWEAGLGYAHIQPAETNVRVYAFRQRAALFGHNAPTPNLVYDADGNPIGAWDGFEIRDGVIELDAAHPGIVPGGWVALVAPPSPESDRGYVELYRATKVSFPSLSRFALSGKATRIHPDTDERLGDGTFGLRETSVFAQTEPLEIAEPPLTKRPAEAPSKPVPLDVGVLAPVEGTRIRVSTRVTPPPPGRSLIVSGKRLRARVATGVFGLELTSDDGARSAVLQPGETLIVLQRPGFAPGGVVEWRLRHDDGWEGVLTASVDDLSLSGALESDETVAERVEVDSADGNPTEIVLRHEGLSRLYDRSTVRISANVVRATHGETVGETAGGGDANRSFQTFALKQRPLTHVRADTPSGMVSTLEVRVNDLLWQSVPNLYQRAADDPVFVERTGADEQTSVTFGDGVSGARPPGGQLNVRFTCRKGGGRAGLLKAGQLTQLLTRPLGVKGVINPFPTEGATDPESLEDARTNAPLTVLTLDRVVSLQDHEDFARAYPGIGKALATWTWNGRARGVLLTLAGPEGEAIDATGVVARGVLNSIHRAGDPFVPVRAAAHRAAFFEVAGGLVIDPRYEADKVLAAARAALRNHFSFARRRFGQPVMLSEVIAVLHSVGGVIAVDVDHLQRTDVAVPEDPAPRLPAEAPVGGPEDELKPAELLLLAPGNLEEITVKS